MEKLKFGERIARQCFNDTSNNGQSDIEIILFRRTGTVQRLEMELAFFGLEKWKTVCVLGYSQVKFDSTNLDSHSTFMGDSSFFLSGT